MQLDKGGVKEDDENTEKTPLQEQSDIIISSVVFMPRPSEQSDHRLPEEAKAQNRGKRRKPMMRGDKTVGHKDVEL